MSPEAIDHVDLVVTSLERSLPFYEALLRPLGYTHASEIVGEQGERVVYLNRGHFGSIGLRERRSADAPARADRYAIGLHHLAFAAPDRAVVNQIATLARGLGAEIESGPEEYDYTADYYAVFLHDPDGIKLEFVDRPRS